MNDQQKGVENVHYSQRGTKKDKAPTAKPAINLPAQIKSIFVVAPTCKEVPSMKTIHQQEIEYFREIRSAMGPAMRAPTKAPNSRMEVTIPLRTGLTSEPY